MLRQIVGTVLDKPEQLNALAKMGEAQREAPNLAGRRMRYPAPASRAATHLSYGRPGPDPLIRWAERLRPATSRKPGIGSPCDRPISVTGGGKRRAGQPPRTSLHARLRGVRRRGDGYADRPSYRMGNSVSGQPGPATNTAPIRASDAAP